MLRSTVTMPLARRERPVIRHTIPSSAPGPIHAPAPMTPPNHDLSQEFMQACMKTTQAVAAPTPAARARGDTNRLLKPRNLNLYYNYYFIE